jgi:hypothetical protein
MSNKAGIEFYGGYQVYSESGVDLTLLRENLKRPIEARLKANENQARFIRMIRQSNARETAMPILDMLGFLTQLNKHNVEYVVIGGQAMIFQGSAYNTLDLDICYSHSPANIRALVDAIGPLHPYLRGVPPGLPFRWDVPTIQAGLNFTLTTDLGDIDVLGEVSGVGDYQRVVASSEIKRLGDMSIRVLTIDGLIAAKKAAARTKDSSHLLELEELKKLRDANA